MTTPILARSSAQRRAGAKLIGKDEDERLILVGLGEIRVTKNPQSVLTCLGLGSCIGVAAYDPQAKVAGMSHIVLPGDPVRNAEPSPKYALHSVPMLLKLLCSEGADPKRLVINLAGGARINLAGGAGGMLKIGESNLEATVRMLALSGLTPRNKDVGGNRGRTLKLYAGTGKVTVSTVGTPAREL